MVLGAYCDKCTHQSTVDRLTVLKEAQYKQHGEFQSIHLNVKANALCGRQGHDIQPSHQNQIYRVIILIICYFPSLQTVFGKGPFYKLQKNKVLSVLDNISPSTNYSQTTKLQARTKCI